MGVGQWPGHRPCRCHLWLLYMQGRLRKAALGTCCLGGVWLASCPRSPAVGPGFLLCCAVALTPDPRGPVLRSSVSHLVEDPSELSCSPHCVSVLLQVHLRPAPRWPRWPSWLGLWQWSTNCYDSGWLVIGVYSPEVKSKRSRCCRLALAETNDNRLGHVHLPPVTRQAGDWDNGLGATPSPSV